MSVANHVERGAYRDSVALMRIARRLAELPGVAEAAVMIGTPANRALLREAGMLAAQGDAAGADDIVLAVRAVDEASTHAALDAGRALLAAGREAPGGTAPARTLPEALGRLPEANLALVSVPGEFAAAEARRALERGLNVLVFSDNVPLADEVALKRLARERGLLMMGPDCGTALLGGTPLAFANAVPRGEVGIVSASGTGLQEVSSIVARLGGGVSQGIGVGGRDLDAAVGGLGTLAALEVLEADRATRVIVLVSKPPAPAVAARVLEQVARSAKPCVVCFLGLAEPRLPANARAAATLCEAAELAAGRALDEPLPPPRRVARGSVRGLFCGGTLSAEAELGFRAAGLPIGERAHAFLDLGADRYTRGRPHPMIEPELRTAHLREALADPAVAAILVDVVLGFGAHPDPAGVLARALGGAEKPVIASVTGTDADPQNRSRQVALLRGAGVLVAPSNAHASAYAAKLASQCSPA